MKSFLKKSLSLILALILIFSMGLSEIFGSTISLFAIEASAATYSSDLSIKGQACRDENLIISWTVPSNVTSCYYTLVDDNGYTVSSGYAQKSGTSCSCSVNLGSYVVYGTDGTHTGWKFIIKSYTSSTIYTDTYSGIRINWCGSINTHLQYGITYDANGGSGGPSYQEWPNTCSGTATLSTSTPTRNGYRFKGWSWSSEVSTVNYLPGSTVSFDHNYLILYAVWEKMVYTLTYNANGGNGAPSSQTGNTSYTVSSIVPTRSGYNFIGWSTNSNATSASYTPGSAINISQDTTLYAVWSKKTYTLSYNANGGSGAPASQSGNTSHTISNTKPTRNGYTFLGWATSSSSATPSYAPGDTISINTNTTLYAIWEIANQDIYNIGEETYSFANIAMCEGNKCNGAGHCFGMSMTSSGYYLNELNIDDVGGNKTGDVYALENNTNVREPICYYQKIQASIRNTITVAGGSWYLTGGYSTNSDWNAVINYVKSHNYDNKGTLQVGLKNNEGGHAVNFLRYEEVNGQQRIYVYDNNFPESECYLYMDSKGYIREAPYSTFATGIKCIALRSIPQYFDIVGTVDLTRYVYAKKGEINIEGVEYYELDCGVGFGDDIVFVVADGVEKIKIVPLVDNAEFTYLDNEYSFGKTNDETIGVFTLATNDENGSDNQDFVIINGEPTIKIKNNPGSKTINYGDFLQLTAVVTDIPEGAYIQWYKGEERSVKGDTIYIEALNGSAVFTAKLVDANGNALKDSDGNEISDSQTVSVNASFWQKIVSFFKNLFGLNRIIVQSFKNSL